MGAMMRDDGVAFVDGLRAEAVRDAFFSALVLDRAEDWMRLADALAALPPKEGAALAFVALSVLPETSSMGVVDAYTSTAGWPLPPLMALATEARAWVDWASPRERKFYIWALVERLSPADRCALVAAINGLDRPEGGSA